jgi:hypothetical protein
MGHALPVRRARKPMGRKPAWNPGLAVEKPDQNEKYHRRTGLNSAACETEAEPRDFLLDRSRRTTETEGNGICTACLRASAGECSEKNQDSVGVPVTEIE